MTTITIIEEIEQDIQQHVEDDVRVNAIRNGKIVEVFWNELTESEKREAYCNMFNI